MGTSARRRWIRAGEVVREGGHGQSAENDEAARYHERGDVVARDVLEQTLGHINKSTSYILHIK